MSAVARAVGCHFTVVYDSVHRFNASGFTTFEQPSNPRGRVPVITATQLRDLIDVALSIRACGAGATSVSELPHPTTCLVASRSARRGAHPRRRGLASPQARMLQRGITSVGALRHVVHCRSTWCTAVALTVGMVVPMCSLARLVVPCTGAWPARWPLAAGIALVFNAVGVAAAGPSGPPLLPWSTLDRGAYRAVLGAGVRARLVAERPLDPALPIVVFIHGAEGAPAQFAPMARALGGGANLAAFFYDDTARLAASAESLRRQLSDLRGVILIVAHSMGALLPAYIGATSPAETTRCITALYLNPLIGGSHYADDIPALRWLRPVKPLVQRRLFRPSVQDLAPESAFEQTIFGSRSAASSFAVRTVILFTEVTGEEPDIVETRVPRFFARARGELLGRLGRVVPKPAALPAGHNSPLRNPNAVLPLVETALAMARPGAAACAASQ